MDDASRKPAKYLFTLVAAILIFNLIDGVVTLTLVHAGLAREANPLMATTLDRGPLAFMAVKLALVSLGVYLLWLRRERRPALIALGGLAAVYGGLILYHVRSLAVLAGHVQ